MSEREPEVIYSRRCRKFIWEGYRLEVNICRLDDRPGWSLEVINESGTSIVLDELFATERDADDAFKTILAEEGLAAFLDDDGGNVIPFPGTRMH